MTKFSYKPQSELGIASNDINIYKGKRIIGYIESRYLPRFKKGDYSKFRPVSNWRNIFSQSLKIELGLIKANPNGKMARTSSRKKTATRAKKKTVTRGRKKTAVVRAKKKGISRRVSRPVKRKATVKRNPGPVVYKLKVGSSYFDGGGMTADPKKACCFTSLDQAKKIGNRLATATGKKVAVHSNRAVKKK